jgi:predicted enzyme related to lactoylglutathione lyase
VSSFVLNITFDSADPQAQAAFWAAVTGYPASDGSRPGNPFWLVASPREEDGLRLAFVPTGDAKNGKNRVHVDIVPGDRSQAAELHRLIGLGASVVDDRRQIEGAGWVVLADPEGNEFCLERD